MAVRLLPTRTSRAAVDRPSVLTERVVLSAVRTLVGELPLGSAPRPFDKRLRWSWDEALAAVEDALVSVAATHDVAIDLRDVPEDLARRLGRSKAIAPAAADAAVALVPVLRCGATGCVDAGLRDESFRLTERLEGYLRSAATPVATSRTRR